VWLGLLKRQNNIMASLVVLCCVPEDFCRMLSESGYWSLVRQTYWLLAAPPIPSNFRGRL
jgi:hypothetical protein